MWGILYRILNGTGILAHYEYFIETGKDLLFCQSDNSIDRNVMFLTQVCNSSRNFTIKGLEVDFPFSRDDHSSL